MYVPTVADWGIISIIVVVMALLAVHWPDKGDNAPPDIFEHVFKMGVNAVRVNWNAKTGHHDITVWTRRLSDHEPKIGDIITFVEHDQTRFRTRVVDITCVVELAGNAGKQTTITAEAV